MHIHGLLDNSTTWNIAKAEAAGEAVCVVFQYLFDENNPAYAYFDYKISITYENTVTQAGLRQSISFTNYSNRAMPFAFAYHTAFNLPFNASPKEAFVVQANLKGMYELHNELPTGRVTALDEAGTQAAAAGYCIRGAALDHLYLADSSRQNRAVFKQIRLPGQALCTKRARSLNTGFYAAAAGKADFWPLSRKRAAPMR